MCKDHGAPSTDDTMLLGNIGHSSVNFAGEGEFVDEFATCQTAQCRPCAVLGVRCARFIFYFILF